MQAGAFVGAMPPEITEPLPQTYRLWVGVRSARGNLSIAISSLTRRAASISDIETALIG
jgi:hypothetical protein